MLKYQKITDMICAPFTGFDKEGQLNLDIVPRYLQYLIDAGVKGVFLNGSTGEGYLLSEEERMHCVEKWLDAVGDTEFKVIVHVGTNSVVASAKLAEHAQSVGADGVSVMGPTYPKINTIEQLLAYCEIIAAGAPNVPFYYYHIPALSGVELSMLDFLRAVEDRIENFVGIKYTSDNLYEYTQCRRYKNNKFDLLHGQDETMLASLVLADAQGCVGGTFNYAGSLYVGIREAYKNGDLTEATRLQRMSMDLVDVVAKYRGNIVAGKQIMKLLGLDFGDNRVPFKNMTQAEIQNMDAELRDIGFYEYCNAL